MALRTGKGEGFIPVGTTFIEMEEKFLLWLRELKQLRSDAREKGTVQGDTGEIVPPETVDKLIALLWWNLVRPPYPSPHLSPFSSHLADFQQTGIHNIPPQRPHPLRDPPYPSPEIRPRAPPPFMDAVISRHRAIKGRPTASQIWLSENEYRQSVSQGTGTYFAPCTLPRVLGWIGLGRVGVGLWTGLMVGGVLWDGG